MYISSSCFLAETREMEGGEAAQLRSVSYHKRDWGQFSFLHGAGFSGTTLDGGGLTPVHFPGFTAATSQWSNSILLPSHSSPPYLQGIYKYLEVTSFHSILPCYMKGHDSNLRWPHSIPSSWTALLLKDNCWR